MSARKSMFTSPANLFGADVIRRAEGPAAPRPRRPRCRWLRGPGPCRPAWPRRPGEHDVLGLDVAVDEAALVGVLQGLGDLDDDLERLVLAEDLAGGQLVVDRVALDVLHDEIVVVAGLADVDGLHDVGWFRLAAARPSS